MVIQIFFSKIRRNLRKCRPWTAAVWTLLVLALAAGSLSGCAGKDRDQYGKNGEIPDTTEDSYGVFLGIDQTTFSPDLFKDYETVVIDAQELRKEQLAQLHVTGHTVYSYLNVGSIEKTRLYYEDFKDCRLDRYDNWPDEYWVDVTRPEWKELVTQDLVEEILEKDPQIDGLFLDNLDIYAHVSERRKYSDMSGDVYDSLREILEAYQEAGIPVLVNGADLFVSTLLEDDGEDLLLGVNQETVFTRILDYEHDRFGTQKESEQEYYTEYLKKCKKAGLEVFLLEYTSDEEIELEILRYCRKNGFRCYISSHVDLDPEKD